MRLRQEYFAVHVLEVTDKHSQISAEEYVCEVISQSSRSLPLRSAKLFEKSTPYSLKSATL